MEINIFDRYYLGDGNNYFKYRYDKYDPTLLRATLYNEYGERIDDVRVDSRTQHQVINFFEARIQIKGSGTITREMEIKQPTEDLINDTMEFKMPDLAEEENKLLNAMTKTIETLDEYIEELIKITSEKTGIPIDIIKVNREEVKKYFDDGIPPYFCFREEYN